MSAVPTDNADRVLLRLENVSKTFQMGEVAVERCATYRWTFSPASSS